MRTQHFAAALVALVGLAGQAWAQSSGTARDDASAGASSRTSASASGAAASSGAAQGDLLEQHIAVGLYLGNQEEIALSQFGLQRAQHDQVKQFAQHMVEQHQQAISQIQQAAPQLASMNLELTAAQGGASGGASRSGASSSGTSGASASGQSSPAGARSATPGSSTGGADATSTLGGGTTGASGNQRAAGASAGAQGGPLQQMAQYMREVKERCVALSAQQLGRQQGPEFDKAFMGMQVALHTNMLAHLQAAQGHVSSQMQPIVQQGIEMTQNHIAQANQIMEQLDSQQGQGGAPRAASGQGETSRQ